MKTTIRVSMKPVNMILAQLGVDKNGDVQQFVTDSIDRRITRYMPFLSGNLSTKLKHVKSATEIEVLGPYARYQYFGKAMTGIAPRVVTDKNLRYTKTFNTNAGPFWDVRLMAEEGDQIAAEAQEYARRK